MTEDQSLLHDLGHANLRYIPAAKKCRCYMYVYCITPSNSHSKCSHSLFHTYLTTSVNLKVVSA